MQSRRRVHRRGQHRYYNYKVAEIVSFISHFHTLGPAT